MTEELFHALSSLRFAGLGAPTVEDPRTLRPWFMRAKKLWQQQPWQKISPEQVLTVSLPTRTYQVMFPSPRQIRITDGQAPILLAYGFEPEIQPGLPEFFRSHRLPPSDHDQGLYPLFAVAEQANYVPVDESVQETLLTVLKAVTEFLDLSALAPSIPVQATVKVVVDKDSTLMVPVSLAPPAPNSGGRSIPGFSPDHECQFKVPQGWGIRGALFSGRLPFWNNWIYAKSSNREDR